LIVDELLEALGDAAKKFVAVEDRGDLATDVIEQAESVSLLQVGDKEARWDGIGVAYHGEWGEFSSFVHHKEYTRGPWTDIDWMWKSR
jgi:hypothetical protein